MSEMRYLASVVTQCFTAFGELLGMQKRFAELSGGVTRVSELGGTLRAAAAQEATIRNIAAADDITRVSRPRACAPADLPQTLCHFRVAAGTEVDCVWVIPGQLRLQRVHPQTSTAPQSSSKASTSCASLALQGTRTARRTASCSMAPPS